MIFLQRINTVYKILELADKVASKQQPFRDIFVIKIRHLVKIPLTCPYCGNLAALCEKIP
jgi:hypothetical protein